jgi:hypothetical protein
MLREDEKRSLPSSFIFSSVSSQMLVLDPKVLDQFLQFGLICWMGLDLKTMLTRAISKSVRQLGG